jgi:hypothetical protein
VPAGLIPSLQAWPICGQFGVVGNPLEVVSGRVGRAPISRSRPSRHCSHSNSSGVAETAPLQHGLDLIQRWRSTMLDMEASRVLTTTVGSGRNVGGTPPNRARPPRKRVDAGDRCSLAASKQECREVRTWPPQPSSPEGPIPAPAQTAATVPECLGRSLVWVVAWRLERVDRELGTAGATRSRALGFAGVASASRRERTAGDQRGPRIHHVTSRRQHNSRPPHPGVPHFR